MFFSAEHKLQTDFRDDRKCGLTCLFFFISLQQELILALAEELNWS